MSSPSISDLLPSMLDEFKSLIINPRSKPTPEQIKRLNILKRGAEHSAYVTELGISAIGAAIGASIGELDENHLRNLGWLLELLGEFSGMARHIEYEANSYLRL